MPRPLRGSARGWEDYEYYSKKVMDITGLDPRTSEVALQIMRQLISDGDKYETELRSVFPLSNSRFIRYQDWIVDDNIGLCPEGYMQSLWSSIPSGVLAECLRSNCIPERSTGQWEIVRLEIPAYLDIHELHKSVMDRMREQDPDAEPVWNFDVLEDEQEQRIVEVRVWVDWDWLDQVWIASLPWSDVCCVHYDRERETAIRNIRNSMDCFFSCASEYGKDLIRDCCALFERDTLLRVMGDKVEVFCEQTASWDEVEDDGDNLLACSHSQVLNMLVRSGWKVRRFGENQVVLYNHGNDNWRSKGWIVFPFHDQQLPQAIMHNVFGFYRTYVHEESLHNERPRIRSTESYYEVQTIGSWVNHDGSLYTKITIKWTDNGATCWWINDFYFPPSVIKWIGDFDILHSPEDEVPHFFTVYNTEEGAKRIMQLLGDYHNGTAEMNAGFEYSLDYRYVLNERSQAIANKTAGMITLELAFAGEPYTLYGFYDVAGAAPVLLNQCDMGITVFVGKILTR